ncbi:MAG: ABC transporter permease [Magnetococcales bacterium]|nr:ABC transporter permease [Magnetococcales bacterium]
MHHHFSMPSWRFLQVWRRHFLVWRKTLWASLAGNLGEPLLYIAGMGLGLGTFVGTLDGMPYLLFVGGGILAASSMNTATFEAFYGGFTRMTRQNTFHAMLVTPLDTADIVAGEVAWAASKSLLAGSAIFLVGALLGAFPGPYAILALPVVLLSGLVFAALGMVVVAISPGYEFFPYYSTFVITPMFMFCGVFFPLSGMPEPLATAIYWLPLSHVVALIRPLTIGAWPSDILLHLALLLGYFLVAFYWAVRLVKRRILV